MERISRRARWAVAAGVVALAGAVAVVTLPARAQPHSGQPGGPAAAPTANMIDHGGPILSASRTYVLWWGSPSAWPSDVAPGIASFLSGLNASSWLGVADQYARGSPVSSSFAGTWSDPSTPPSRVEASTLGTEVERAVSRGAFGGKVDPSGVYLVYTSAAPAGDAFCAWHSAVLVDGVVVAVDYLPNTAGVAGCAVAAPSALHQSDVLSSLANDTSHELFESITDPRVSAWYDRFGREIGDKCVASFSSVDGGVTTLTNGSSWFLQMEWSNALGGCVAGG